MELKLPPNENYEVQEVENLPIFVENIPSCAKPSRNVKKYEKNHLLGLVSYFRNRSMHFLQANLQYGRLYCSVCQCLLGAEKKTVKEHVNGKHHQLKVAKATPASELLKKKLPKLTSLKAVYHSIYHGFTYRDLVVSHHLLKDIIKNEALILTGQTSKDSNAPIFDQIAAFPKLTNWKEASELMETTLTVTASLIRKRICEMLQGNPISLVLCQNTTASSVPILGIFARVVHEDCLKSVMLNSLICELASAEMMVGFIFRTLIYYEIDPLNVCGLNCDCRNLDILSKTLRHHFPKAKLLSSLDSLLPDLSQCILHTMVGKEVLQFFQLVFLFSKEYPSIWASIIRSVATKRCPTIYTFLFDCFYEFCSYPEQCPFFFFYFSIILMIDLWDIICKLLLNPMLNQFLDPDSLIFNYIRGSEGLIIYMRIQLLLNIVLSWLTAFFKSLGFNFPQEFKGQIDFFAEDYAFTSGIVQVNDFIRAIESAVATTNGMEHVKISLGRTKKMAIRLGYWSEQQYSTVEEHSISDHLEIATVYIDSYFQVKSTNQELHAFLSLAQCFPAMDERTTVTINEKNQYVFMLPQDVNEQLNIFDENFDSNVTPYSFWYSDIAQAKYPILSPLARKWLTLPADTNAERSVMLHLTRVIKDDFHLPLSQLNLVIFIIGNPYFPIYADDYCSDTINKDIEMFNKDFMVFQNIWSQFSNDVFIVP
eukprot:TRINITY_DN9232_c0_g1_i1.p1 TRINITY_DN9232_c0_g1~~TRINITY_DN9232_c0_g1_i1.p1  ORF type:complete len:736 (+),score=149.73 TRINITY_DN9232_c0_g1_i1:89-2209(+)